MKTLGRRIPFSNACSLALRPHSGSVLASLPSLRWRFLSFALRNNKASTNHRRYLKQSGKMPKGIYTVTYFFKKFPEGGCKLLPAVSKKAITEECIKGWNREKKGLHRTSLVFGESSSEEFSTGYLSKSKLAGIILSQISQGLPFQVRFFLFLGQII